MAAHRLYTLNRDPRTDPSRTRRTQHHHQTAVCDCRFYGACAALVGETDMGMRAHGFEEENIESDSKTRPFAMAMSPGAALMLEQFMAAVVQEIMAQVVSFVRGVAFPNMFIFFRLHI